MPKLLTGFLLHIGCLQPTLGRELRLKDGFGLAKEFTGFPAKQAQASRR